MIAITVADEFAYAQGFLFHLGTRLTVHHYEQVVRPAVPAWPAVAVTDEIQFTDLLGSNDGDEWDTVNISIVVPANATMLTIQAFSEDRNNTGALPASFIWTGAAMALREDEPPGLDGRFTGGFIFEKRADLFQGDVPGGENIESASKIVAEK